MQAEIFCEFAGHEVPSFGEEMDMIVKDLIKNICAGAEVRPCCEGKAAIDL